MLGAFIFEMHVAAVRGDQRFRLRSHCLLLLVLLNAASPDVPKPQAIVTDVHFQY
jgi:hypothetical protein